MDIHCPKCGQVVEPHDINEEADFLVCMECDEAYRISEFTQKEKSFDIEDPPRGVYFKKKDTGFAIYASSRCIGIAIFFLAFVVLMAVFFVNALYQAFHNDQSDFWIAIPVGILGLLFLYGALTFIFAKVVIAVEGDRGTLFQGIGKRGKTLHFRWSGVTDVRQELVGKGRSALSHFVIDSGIPIRATLQLSPDKFEYITFALRAMLKKRDSLTDEGESK